MGFWHWLLSKSFLPHEYCYRLNPSLIQLHYWSDLLIGVAYVAISLTLVYLVWQGRRDIPFHSMFLAFGAFIIACGGTHFMEVWTLTTPVYWLSGIVKSLTAAASVATALALPPLVPKTLGLVRSARISDDRQRELEAANAALETEILERGRAEEQVRRMAADLENRVQERTRELARANEELIEKASIVQHSQDAIFSWTLDGAVASWNPAAESMYGYTGGEIIGRKAALLVPAGQQSEFSKLLKRLQDGAEIQPFETTRVRKDGASLAVHVSVSALRDEAGRVRGASVITRDITEARRAEQQLQQVQKMESLGVIAGGVAHDFNNLLVGIMGNASMALETLAETDPNRELLAQVVRASESAAHLTQQLLAYAGKGRFVSQRVGLSELARDTVTLVQASIPDNVDVRMDLAGELPAVEADPAQLQQVIMNLLINGAESIVEGHGTVRVTTGQRTIEPHSAWQDFTVDGLSAGRYVTLEVRDSGCGMDEATRARIFDPFFTTKFTGRGLGLSAVLGIVRSHKGGLRVVSAPGRGSTFEVLLPAAEGTPKAQATVAPADEDLLGTGLVLVVDDEEVVRSTARNALVRYGYHVLTACDGQEGVEIFRQHASEIDVVLLDMTMPVMGGAEAYHHIREERPDARVIVSSGFDQVEAARRFASEGIVAFIQKPYTARTLARVVKQVAGHGRRGELE